MEIPSNTRVQLVLKIQVHLHEIYRTLSNTINFWFFAISKSQILWLNKEIGVADKENLLMIELHPWDGKSVVAVGEYSRTLIERLANH